MSRAILFLFALSLVLLSCEDEPERESSPGWGIDFSPVESSTDAFGYISMQNVEGNEAYLVDAAYVKQIRAERYQVVFRFTSLDSLVMVVAKRTEDPNFHYPRPDSVNQLLLATFNRDTLRLNRSSLSIQPQRETDNFRTFTDLHTNDGTSINGTINGIPLIE